MYVFLGRGSTASRPTARYWPPIGGRYMSRGGGAVEKLVKSNPRWFSEMFPNFREMAEAFDDMTQRNRVGMGLFRLSQFLDQP